MNEIIWAVTLLLLLVTILPLFPIDHWVCRIWEFPRIQLCVFLAITFVFGGLYVQGASRFWVLGLTLAMLIYHVCWILPYTILFPVNVSKAINANKPDTISFLTSNVYTPNRSADKLLALISQYQPDIVVTLESDSWWQNALSSLHKDYPYRVAKPLDNLYGMHVYSKLELIEPEVKEMVQQGVPSVHCGVKLKSGEKIQCHFLHPAPPSPTENAKSTKRDKELLQVAKIVKQAELPTVVTGDLNDVAWSKTTSSFKAVSGLVDPRVGRGPFNTFHAKYPVCRWPLDHIFHSPTFELVKIERLASIDSDHFPLFSELVLVNGE